MTPDGKYIESCAERLIQKYKDCGGNDPISHDAFESLCWTFEGIYAREKSEGCEAYIRDWKYTPPHRFCRAYA